MDVVTSERLEKYFSVTTQALLIAQQAPRTEDERAAIILDMAERYVKDATYFAEKGDKVLAFAALNYAHGWLDCGARLGIYEVTDDQLFTVDR